MCKHKWLTGYDWLRGEFKLIRHCIKCYKEEELEGCRV